MKQRNAMIAVWTALLISIGTALSLSIQSSILPVEDDPFVLPESALKPGESRRVSASSDVVEVRLFVEGLPFRESPRTQELMNKAGGILLADAQRELLDRSLTRYRLLPSESEDTPACFDPHHVFRYFNAKGEEVGNLEVCYCCRQVRLNSWSYRRFEGEILKFDFEGIAAMLKSMDIPIDVGCRERV